MKLINLIMLLMVILLMGCVSLDKSFSTIEPINLEDLKLGPPSISDIESINLPNKTIALAKGKKWEYFAESGGNISSATISLYQFRSTNDIESWAANDAIVAVAIENKELEIINNYNCYYHEGLTYGGQYRKIIGEYFCFNKNNVIHINTKTGHYLVAQNETKILTKRVINFIKQ